MGSLVTPQVVEDCFGLLKLYSDGSIFRSTDTNQNTPIHDDGSSIWKDYLFDETHHLSLRLYKPTTTINPPSRQKKLPILFYIHAGGFCFGSRSTPNFHNSCLTLCSMLQVFVVAPDYRLAPEHRLPAAIDDAYIALKWVQAQALSQTSPDHMWLCEDEADFERVFVMGDSSGGNIAHHLAVRLGAGSVELEPVRVRGYVLLAPFFGGTVRTRSEDSPCEAFWTLDMYDRFWRLSLPEGATLDHPLANPFGPMSSSLKDSTLDPILVLVGGCEIMRDRVEDYSKRLKELGKKVKYLEFQGKHHSFFTDNSFSEEAKPVIQIIKDFISKNSSSSSTYIIT